MPKPVRLSDNIMVITGASSGIGRAVALAMAEQGVTLVLAARRRDALETLREECERRGGRAFVVPTDVTEAHEVERLARTAIENVGRIDVWINNAAVTLFGRLEETPLEPFRRVLETNLLGTVHGARAALPYFREQGHGLLINMASVAGKIGQPYTSAYCASKFGIVGLSECLRQELLDAPDIHVCTILPASIDTPLFQHGANYTGRAVKPMSPVYAAERVAAAVVGCVERPRREVVVGPAGRLGLALHALAPATAERRIASKVERDHLRQVPAEPTDGNLLEPMPGWTTTGGGWRRPRRSAWPMIAAVSVGAIGAAVLVRSLDGGSRHTGGGRSRGGRGASMLGLLKVD